MASSNASSDSAAHRARWARWLLVALAAVLLAGCGGDDDDRAADPLSETEAAPPAATAEDAPRRAVAEGELRVSFLDVGQGDATLLQAPDATVLIDAGRHDRGDVVPALRARGVGEIDVVAITHGHADHIGQLPEVLRAFPTAEVWMSGTPHTTLTFERALEAVEASDASYEEPRAGAQTEVGSLSVEIVHPQRLTGDLHADSLSMRVTFGDVSFLFTGDAEAPHEREMVGRDPDLLAVTVYQVGHHGSRTSSSGRFLAAVAPEVAVYSAAEDNEYGHPHREVVDRLRAAGIEIYGTDVHGTVTVRTDGAGHVVSPERAGRPRGRPPPGPGPEPEPETAGCVDINSASSEDLQRIRHVGPDRAQEIINLRPFTSVDDLTRVSGLAMGRLSDIRAQGLICD